MKTSAKRRQLLKFYALGSAIALAGCGRSDKDILWHGGWDPAPWLMFRAGDSRVSVDLSLTLPAGVRSGGTFSVASTSDSLPPGISLSSQGILTALNPVEGITSNIIFTYSEPGS